MFWPYEVNSQFQPPTLINTKPTGDFKDLNITKARVHAIHPLAYPQLASLGIKHFLGKGEE